MKLSPSTIALGALACISLTNVNGFTTPTRSVAVRQNVGMSMSTMAESGVPPPTSDATDTAEDEIPTNLPSDCGMDYIPLATMLATGQLAEADQVGFFLCQKVVWKEDARIPFTYLFYIFSPLTS